MPDLADETKGGPRRSCIPRPGQSTTAANYETAIKYYEKLESRYPYGALRATGAAGNRYAYYKDESPRRRDGGRALHQAAIPINPNVDYAYYERSVELHGAPGLDGHISGRT
jgi:outer membrane protein assembly factor BamD